MEILRSALGMSKNITEPGTIIELPFIWDDPFWLANE